MTQKDPALLTLPSGLRLVHIRHRGAAAAIFGIAVRAGSADESAGHEGLAHFVEHTIFKGTAHRSSWHIINRMEAVGGELNAFTTKEETVVYSILPTGAERRAIELIADLASSSQFPLRELDKERQVVLDEIASYRDIPAEAIYDDFEDMAFAGTPLGHNILGTKASVEHLDSDACRRFLQSFYTTDNIVLFYSGAASAERIAAMAERYFCSLPKLALPRQAHIPDSWSTPVFCRTEDMDTHQCHVLMGIPTGGIYSPQRHAVALFANIIAGPGMNSLLNLELRERRGLVYNVEASTASFAGAGLLNVYFGCDAADLDYCIDICHRTFRRMADGALASGRRLAAAKKQYLGQLSVAAENRENTIMNAARATLFRGTPPSWEATRQAIVDIQQDEIASLAHTMTNHNRLIFRGR